PPASNPSGDPAGHLQQTRAGLPAPPAGLTPRHECRRVPLWSADQTLCGTRLSPGLTCPRPEWQRHVEVLCWAAIAVGAPGPVVELVGDGIDRAGKDLTRSSPAAGDETSPGTRPSWRDARAALRDSGARPPE